MKQGNIGVSTENIFPIIKKFLYSEHEIFLRELVSNAVDATQKLKVLSSVGEFKGEIGEANVEIKIDKDAKTITISDKGLGMTADEVEKYINQIAFSGAEEFLDKFKDQNPTGIIGHFGLGFYSSFMVSKKVEIKTLSYKENSQAVRWECDGSPVYTLEDCEKTERGTDIILHLDDESLAFLEEDKISGLLNRFCKFLPVPIVLGKKKEWKDGKQVETSELNIINDTNPLWTKKPADIKDEEYNQFYRKLYPMAEDPIFNIHLNVDYPFNLTGVLYFPKVKNTVELQKNKIQLYCNQVFVTDSVENIVPDFLTLLHGVIDSPDIPLNVSRSYLQGDPNVKKISAHITKKVADKLEEIFKSDRKTFEEKWDDIRIFIEYGMLTEEKFHERAKKFYLFKSADDKFYTMEEYKVLIGENQKDKDGNLVFLYTSDKTTQYTYINEAKSKNYDVLVLDTPLTPHFINKMEQDDNKNRFVRVDADTIDRLIVKEDKKKQEMPFEEQAECRAVFEKILPKDIDCFVNLDALGESVNPVVITQNEFMRRMKEMQNTSSQGMNFYGMMKDSYTITINTDHRLVKRLLDEKNQAVGETVVAKSSEIKAIEQEKTSILPNDKKEEDLPQESKDKVKELDDKLALLNNQKHEILENFGKDNELAKQLIDLALLSNNMLKGEALSNFVKRSVELIK